MANYKAQESSCIEKYDGNTKYIYGLSSSETLERGLFEVNRPVVEYGMIPITYD